MKIKSSLFGVCAGAAVMLSGGLANAAVVNITSADINGIARWYNTNTYVLDGFVYVEEGEELHIEPGTVIKAKSDTGANSTGLFITRGGKIFAEGTAEAPIIFTSVEDNTVGATGLHFAEKSLDPATESGKWGGISIFGKGLLNSAADTTGNGASPRYDVYEGQPDTVFNGKNVFRFGGNDNADNSGVLRYVSIRYSGVQLAADKELNGLTLGAVGSGTTIEFVEVYGGTDDGFEWWGGAVNGKYLVASYIQDDMFDADQGYIGKNQFVFGMAFAGTDKGMELDGEVGTITQRTPLAQYSFYNMTLIGSGVALNIRDHAMPRIHNSVLTGFALGIDWEADNQNAHNAGEVQISHNIFAGTTGTADTSITGGDVYFTDSLRTNLTVSAQLVSTNGVLDPRPAAGSPALTLSNVKTVPADGFYTPVTYLGAFNGKELWTGWSALAQRGHIQRYGLGGTVNITSADINGIARWYNTNTYVLDGFVYVEEGEELHIEPGTVIKAKSDTGANSTGLFITRGGKIFAEGTAEAPIIFTSVEDNTVGATGLHFAEKSLDPATESGKWGGISIFGKGLLNSAADTTGNGASPRYDVYEGQPDTVFNGKNVFRFGGNDNADNSGVLRYVSIRYSGVQLAADKELNGLTLGAVGSGTTIEFVEVYGGTDDGFEWWGGAVNGKYLVASYIQDDMFDADQGYIGKNQFVFGMAFAGTDKGMELDGEVGTITQRTPLAQYSFYNMTLIGSGVALNIRDHAMPRIHNSVLTGFALGIDWEADNQNAHNAGEVQISHNIFAGTTGTADTSITGGDVYFTDSLRTNLTVSAQLVSTNGVLDPRPAAGSPALTLSNVKTVPADGFYTPVTYLGAFNDVNWLAQWTGLGGSGVLSGANLGSPANEGIPAKGPSSSQDPQVEALTAGIDFTAIITVGDTAANSPGWRFVGLADGLGAFDNGDGTFTTLVNHEINETKGIVRAHGAIGTFVSKLTIDKATLQVMAGQDLMTNVYTFNTNTFVYELGVNVLMGRFCSADLPPVSAFYNSGNGKGTQNRIFMNGEEFSTQSRAWAHIASGPETGNSWQLPLLGRASWENVVASPYMQDKTIVVGLDDDGTTDSQVYIYIGTKQTTGASDVEKAGLMNGQLYGVSVAGLAQEVAGTTEGVRNFSLVNLSALTDVRVATFNELEATGNGAGVTAFMRVEDGSWNPTNPNEFYFLTTASSSLPSRLWRLTFTDIANPEAGGVIEMMLNGTEGQLMMDNMVVDQDGNILITEDPGNNARLARIYKYYPATDGLIALGQAKQSLFLNGEAGFLTQDEEVSGVIDMRDILGNGSYLIVNQIHSGAVVSNDPELVEGGQLLVMYVNGSTPAINTQPTPVNVGGGTAATFTVAASSGSTIQWYRNGTPIAGATGTSYSIPAPSTGDAGEYVAVVTTPGGSVSSTAVSLTVTDLAMYAGVAVAGPIGTQYEIQYTTSLSGTPVWTPLETITLSTSPTLYIDQSSPGQTQRFYRAVEVVE